MDKRPNQFITEFLKMESAGGILLFLAALLALIFANTFLNSYYELLLSTPVAVQVGALKIAKPMSSAVELLSMIANEIIAVIWVGKWE